VRLVLDTNVWLDWLVFDDPAIGPLRRAWQAGVIDLAIDGDCEAELERVLGYDLGRRSIDASRQAASLAECRRLARRVDAAASNTPDSPSFPGEAATLPRCRDPDDQKFLVAALAAGAKALLTKDRALLTLARRAPFEILTPEAFAQRHLPG